MGYICHHAIIVTSWDRKYIEPAREKALRIFPVVSEILESQENGYCSIFIPPDGSKEDWRESAEGNDRRAEFIKWLNAQAETDGGNCTGWVEVQYLDEAGNEKVLNSSIMMQDKLNTEKTTTQRAE